MKKLAILTVAIALGLASQSMVTSHGFPELGEVPVANGCNPKTNPNC